MLKTHLKKSQYILCKLQFSSFEDFYINLIFFCNKEIMWKCNLYASVACFHLVSNMCTFHDIFYLHFNNVSLRKEKTKKPKEKTSIKKKQYQYSRNIPIDNYVFYGQYRQMGDGRKVPASTADIPQFLLTTKCGTENLFPIVVSNVTSSHKKQN